MQTLILRGLQHFFFLIIITFSWFDTILTPIFYFWCQLISTFSSLVISLSIPDISLTWLYTSIVTSMWACPIQSISQQQSLEAHKRILPLPVVWLIPCGSYGQCLSQPFWAYNQTDTVLSFGSLMVSKSHPLLLWSEKYVSLFPHHICTAGCDLLQDRKNFL